MFRPSSTPVAGGRYGYQTKLTLLFVQLRFDRRLDLVVKRLIVFQDFFRGVATLGKLRAFVVQPRAALFDDLFLQSNIEECSGRGDSLVVHDVELGLRKRRRDFVLHNFHARAVTSDNAIGLFDGPDAADIDAYTGIEF